MQLDFEYNQTIGTANSPNVAHLSNNKCKMFYLVNGQLYERETIPTMGIWQNSTFSSPKISCNSGTILDFDLYIASHNDVYGIATFDDHVSLIKYDIVNDKFIDLQSFYNDTSYTIKKLDLNTQLYTQAVQQKYIKIEVLDKKDRVIGRIEGEAIDGSITIDAQSAVRRVCNLTLALKENLLPKQNNLLWVDNRFRVWLGIKDLTTDEIYYYNFGIFIIIDPQVDIQLSEKTISISGYDKVCYLNGDASGSLGITTTIPAKTPIYTAISQTMTQLAGETIDKVKVSTKDCILAGSTNIQLFNSLKDNMTYECYYGFREPAIVKKNGVEITSGFTIDYDKYTVTFSTAQSPTDSFTIDADLIYVIPYAIEKSATDTIWDVVDSVTKLYMNFQSYYDTDGSFVFSAIPNRLNDPIAWDFSYIDMRVSCSNTFNFNNIRNYYKVWGAILDDLTQVSAEEEITDASNQFSTTNIAKRNLVVSEEKYYTIEQCRARLEYEKFLHTNFAEQCSITSPVILFLDVNQLINMDFPEHAVVGKYCINSLTIPLKPDGLMTINAYKIY